MKNITSTDRVREKDREERRAQDQKKESTTARASEAETEKKEIPRVSKNAEEVQR